MWHMLKVIKIHVFKYKELLGYEEFVNVIMKTDYFEKHLNSKLN